MDKTVPINKKYSFITNSISYISGLLFGLGLIISEMVNPNKVLSFLDIFGNWDPSLALVMITAIVIGLPTFYFAKQRVSQHKKAFNDDVIQLPQKTQITKPMIIGNLLFGAGWGMVGLCPGPAIVGASTGESMVLLFVFTMLTGFYLFSWYGKITA